MTVPGVSRITPFFWLTIVICACLDVPAAAYLDRHFGAGYASYLVAGLAVVVLAVQLGVRRPVPALHWLAVLLVSIAATLVAYMVTPYAAAVVFGIALVAAGWLGQDAEHQEHYWLALAAAFGLGAALPPVAMVPLAILAAATVTRWRLVAFWATVVLARVLGGALAGVLHPWESAVALVLLVTALSLPHPTWHVPLPHLRRS